MGEMAQRIIKENKQEIIDMLNVAFSEEWLAYYQYWIGAQVAKGPMRKTIADEFMEHAKEELEHAQLLSDRIIQLGGTPILDPSEWKEHAQCKYEAPTDEYIMALLEQNLTAERCAIARYQKICELCMSGKDVDTFHISRHILAEELDHEQDIEDYIEDIKSSMEHMKA